MRKRSASRTYSIRGTRAVADSPAEPIRIGFCAGVLPAQKLAQTRPGIRGAVLVHSCVPSSFFGTWPSQVLAHIHAKRWAGGCAGRGARAIEGGSGAALAALGPALVSGPLLR